MGSDHARYIGIGVAILAIVALLTAGGYLLDSLLGTLPLFLLLGIAAGFISALYYVYVQLKNLDGG